MVATDPELWMCHYLGGAWRAPLATRMACVLGPCGAVTGQVVLAGRADMDRAHSMLRPAPAIDDLEYRQILAGLGDVALRTPLPSSIAQGAVYLAAPQDAAIAIRLASQIARAGLRPGAFALLYQA